MANVLYDPRYDDEPHLFYGFDTDTKRRFKEIRRKRLAYQKRQRKAKQFAYNMPTEKITNPVRSPSKSQRQRLTMPELYALHRSQEGRCGNPGCGTLILPLGRGRALDHDRSTGKIRGMLCKSCNVGLGLFHDNPRKLVGILVYLGFLDRKLIDNLK